MTDNPEKSEIFVDEDWKSQVQAEKEKARQAAEAPSTGGTSTPSSTTSAAEPPEGPLPPASLPFLLTTLATQAMIALGQVPNPITGKADLRLHQAKHDIDTLGMLEQKTAGNRTAEESALLDDLLHQLRMAYVLMQSAPGPTTDQPASQ
jgi:hypothetical protein